MGTTSLYLGTPGTGKSTLMRRHVDALIRRPEAPIFFVVDHGSRPGAPPLWANIGPTFTDPRAWWRAPVPIARFVGVPGPAVAQLAIDVGWSCYVDDEAEQSIEDWKANPLREIVKRGHHLKNRAGETTEVAAMLASQRPCDLPPDVRGCFARIYVGRLQSFTDARRVFEESWIPNVRSPAEALEVLSRRAPGAFSLWP